VTLGLWVDGKLARTIPVETSPRAWSISIPTRKSGFASRSPKAITPSRLGFIDDPFVKTIAAADVYKDTVNKWINGVTIIGPFPTTGEKPSRKKILVCDPKTGQACVDRIIATWRARPIGGPSRAPKSRG
jgi:hypothetical protein